MELKYAIRAADQGIYDPIKVGDPDDWYEEGGKCTDCGQDQGQYHLPGCDCERCPVCHGQLLTCAHSEIPYAILDNEDQVKSWEDIFSKQKGGI